MKQKWVALGKCEKDNCLEPSVWFTIKDDDIDRQLCSKDFNEEMNSKKIMVKCLTCKIEFDLLKAKPCNHEGFKTMMCPNGHCICNVPIGNFRPATEEEQKLGFGFMLKEEFGGVKG